jgi:hypothetical protein
MTAEDTGKLDSMLHTWDYMSADHHHRKWQIFGYAREQCPVAFDELLKQIRNLRLAPGAEITWMPGNSNVLHAVNLEFDRAG